MKNLLNFLVFTLLLLQPSGAQQTAVPKFDIEKAKQDLKIYKEIVETAHSGIYLYTSKAEFDLLFSQAKTKVSLLNSFHEFYQLLAGLHSKINCGHSSFLASGNLFSEIKRESESIRVFPMSLFGRLAIGIFRFTNSSQKGSICQV